jgi:hypothetical protein
MNIRSEFYWAVAMLLLACAASRVPASDIIVYNTPDINQSGELVPNGQDGTANRPNGDQMGNTVILAGGPAILDKVNLVWGTYNFSGSSPAQNITLSLYQANGPADLTGPGTNGNQPGTLIATQTVNTTALETGVNGAGTTLTFNFGNIHVPGTLVAIASSDLATVVNGNTNIQTGWIPSSDFTPTVGSNPHGDQAWYGTSTPGSFSSNNTWAIVDGGGGPTISNNLMLTFFASVPEPSGIALALVGLVAMAGYGLRQRRRA